MRWLLVAVAVTLVLGACGGGSDEEDMVQAIAASMLADETFRGYGIDEADATCVAERTVDGLGVERLSDIGFAGAGTEEIDLSRLRDEELEVIRKSMASCIAGIDEILVDIVAASILEDPQPTIPIDEAEARCVAEAVIEQIPANRLIALGVRSGQAGEDTDLTPAEVDAFADAYTGCIDLRAVLLDGIAESGADEDVVACLDERISEDDIDTIFTAGLAGEDTDATARRILSPAMEACT